MAGDLRSKGDLVIDKTRKVTPMPAARSHGQADPMPARSLVDHAAGLLPGSRFAKPEESDFFLLLRAVDAGFPDRPRLGETAHPSEEVLRIGQEAGFAFAPRAIAGVTPAPAGTPDEDKTKRASGDLLHLRTYFFGLFGPNGPLPLHYTELAHARTLSARDHGFADFADALQHRMATLFYRAWAEGQPALGLDRPEADSFARRLASFGGYGMASLEGRDAMPDLLRRHFIGRIADGPRGPEGLAAILSGYFGRPTSIEEFVPSLAELPPEARCRLGSAAMSASLGQTTTIGRRVRVHHHRFRVVIGPLCLAAYKRFLPRGPAMTAARAILRNYAGDALEASLNPVLAAAEVPRQSLGVEGRLGWTSWLGRRRSTADARDLTIRVDTRPRPATKTAAAA